MNLKLSLMLTVVAACGSGVQLVLGARYQECTDLDGFYGTLEQHSYRRINSWLTARLQYRHIENQQQVTEVFDALGELLEHTNRQLLMHLSSRAREHYKEAEAMVASLGQIGLLARLNTNNICLESSYRVLLMNDAATGYRSHLHEDDDYFSLGPVERVVQYLCRLRATQCHQVYPQRFKERQDNLNADIVGPLRSFVQQIVELRLENTSSLELELADVVDLTRLERSPRELQVVLEEIGSAASSEERSTLEAMKHEPRDEVHRAAILNAVKKMLTHHSACNHYVDVMGYNVFEQARYDLLFRDTGKTATAGDQAADYYQGWLIYGICHSILKRADYIASALVELAQKGNLNNKLITTF